MRALQMEDKNSRNAHPSPNAETTVVMKTSRHDTAADPNLTDHTMKVSGNALKSARHLPVSSTGAAKTQHSGRTGLHAILSATSNSISRNMFTKRRDVDEIISSSIKDNGKFKRDVDNDSQVDVILPDLSRRYEKVETFAEGGQGTLSIANDRILQRIVAVKSLRKELTSDNKEVKSFIAEARVTAQLDHPAIIPIYSLDTDTEKGLHLAMKIINGKNLKEYLQQIVTNYKLDGIGSFDEAKSLSNRLEIFLRVCDAIAYAHHRNVMHCDLKPENIMLGEYRETYVMDWGIARLINEPGFDPEKWEKPKTISGTPRYLSPEAIVGEHTDHRADIFTLGLILQEVVTLQNAVHGNEAPEIMANIRTGNIEEPVHKFGFRIDGDLKAIILKATAHERDKRYQSVNELSEDLRRYIRAAEVTANPDNFFTKCLRWSYHHRRLMLFIALFAMFTGAVSVAFSLYDKVVQMRLTKDRNDVISIAYGECAYNAFEIDKLALNLENKLRNLVSESIFLMNMDNPRKNTRKLYEYKDLADSEKAPPDIAYSPVYKTKISMDNFIYKLSPGLSYDTVAPILEKIVPLRMQMMKSVLESNPDYILSRENELMLKNEAMNKGMPMHWIYLGLENGLHIAYPGRATYTNDYDPRLRLWYKLAKEKMRPSWGSPYIDIDGNGLVIPYASPILDEGDRFIGAAGLDMSFDQIASWMVESGNTGKYVMEKFIIDNSRRLIVSTKSKYVGATFESKQMININPEMPVLDNVELLASIKKRQYGSMTSYDENTDTEYLFVFARLNTLDWTYIEKINLTMMLEFKSKGLLDTPEYIADAEAGRKRSKR